MKMSSRVAEYIYLIDVDRMQKILTAKDNYRELDEYLRGTGEKVVFLVCGGSIKYLDINSFFETLEDRLRIKVVRFSAFHPNPLYESVVKGVKEFRKSGSNQIIAVGGGSAVDVAKCIKLFSDMDDSVNYLEQQIIPNGVRLLAVPTTAGTGSEATRYAVIYYNGAKQSVTDESSIPSVVLMDPSTLETLPVYQKKCTMLDAFSHSIESLWSVNSTEESSSYAKEAIRLILANYKDSFENCGDGNANMLLASNLAGKAINITQTTAGHAMCYKLTSLYNIPHGHAAAMVNRVLWPWMIKNQDKCIDPRGSKYLMKVFDDIAMAMGADTAEEATDMFSSIYDGLGLVKPTDVRTSDFDILITSVNPDRLKNNPVKLDEATIESLYREILV